MSRGPLPMPIKTLVKPIARDAGESPAPQLDLIMKVMKTIPKDAQLSPGSQPQQRQIDYPVIDDPYMTTETFRKELEAAIEKATKAAQEKSTIQAMQEGGG